MGTSSREETRNPANVREIGAKNQDSKLGKRSYGAKVQEIRRKANRSWEVGQKTKTSSTARRKFKQFRVTIRRKKSRNKPFKVPENENRGGQMEDIIFGLKLTLIGMGSVFAILILLMILMKILERFWGSQQENKTRKKG